VVLIEAQTTAAPPEASTAASDSGGGACSGSRTIVGTDCDAAAGPGRLGFPDDDIAEPGAGVGRDVDADAAEPSPPHAGRWKGVEP